MRPDLEMPMESHHASLLDQFDRELEAAYRGEVYRVRDNGVAFST